MRAIEETAHEERAEGAPPPANCLNLWMEFKTNLQVQDKNQLDC
jgi:hypothetical protein